jgi:hypothetical protein
MKEKNNITWFHMLVYKLFYTVWTPVFKKRPDLVIAFRDYMDSWIKYHKHDR